MTHEHDLTDLCFPLADLSKEDEKRINLWAQAGEEAKIKFGSQTPMAAFNRTKEIYLQYLEKEGLKYDEERGL